MPKRQPAREQNDVSDRQAGRRDSRYPSSFVTGLNFVGRLDFSAQRSGRSFLAACQCQGIDPTQLDAATRRRIDAAMSQLFLATGDLAGIVVSSEEATGRLHRLLAGARQR